MKVLKKNKKYIKEVIKGYSIGGLSYYGTANKRTFTIEDLKEFGPKNILNFLEIYYYVNSKSYYYGGGIDIQKWIGTLDKANVEMVLLSKQDVNTLLFPVMMDEEYTERATNVIKLHRKIIKAINGLAIGYKKNSTEYMKKFEDTKKKLIASKNWSWSKKKEDL